ncbi:MAG: NAD(P)/FAD-dependent oxidoreductase, partial [Planctomycetaceae bacterium]
MSERVRIVILGGGFGGVYTAMHLERLLGRDSISVPGPQLAVERLGPTLGGGLLALLRIVAVPVF